MHHPTDRITHTTYFVTPVVEHWLEREIAQWVHPMKDRSDDPSHHERTLLPRSYISLLPYMKSSTWTVFVSHWTPRLLPVQMPTLTWSDTDVESRTASASLSWMPSSQTLCVAADDRPAAIQLQKYSFKLLKLISLMISKSVFFFFFLFFKLSLLPQKQQQIWWCQGFLSVYPSIYIDHSYILKNHIHKKLIQPSFDTCRLKDC